MGDHPIITTETRCLLRQDTHIRSSMVEAVCGGSFKHDGKAYMYSRGEGGRERGGEGEDG